MVDGRSCEGLSMFFGVMRWCGSVDEEAVLSVGRQEVGCLLGKVVASTRDDCDDEDVSQRKCVAKFNSKIEVRDALMKVCCQPS